MKNVLVVLVGLLLFVPAAAANDASKELSKKELKTLLETASTPQDHMRLASYYEAKAVKYEADAAEHIDLAKMYRAHPTVSEYKHPMAPETAAHCDYVAEQLKKAATEARNLSVEHRKMAAK